MESSSIENYIASLEWRVYRLQHTLQEWRPHVPDAVVRQSQILQTPSYLSFDPTPNAPTRQGELASSSKPVRGADKWRIQLKRFIDKIPPAVEWSRKVHVSDFSILDLIIKGDAKIIQSFSASSPSPQGSSRVIDSLERFALFTDTWVKNAKRSRLVATYLKFLFCSICHVACCNGVQTKHVNQAMELISKGKPDHLKDLRYGALWGVEAIDRLHREGNWGIRSGDILFNCELFQMKERK